MCIRDRDYRVAPYRFPVPLLDAQRAIRLVRSRAAEWNVLPEKVAVLGFSAGGHLAGMCGTHFDAGDPAAADPVERQSCRPDAFAPCYGVLNLNHTRRADLFATMIGKGDPDLATVRSISPAYAVTKETPPCFLWHTAADSVVPVENSLDFAQRLSLIHILCNLGTKRIYLQLRIHRQRSHRCGEHHSAICVNGLVRLQPKRAAVSFGNGGSFLFPFPLKSRLSLKREEKSAPVLLTGRGRERILSLRSDPFGYDRTPVSYTHLDVYKRQAACSSSRERKARHGSSASCSGETP